MKVREVEGTMVGSNTTEQPIIQKQRLEDAFRRFGIEGEDVFYALAFYYFSQNGSGTSHPLNNTVQKGEPILKRVETDQHITRLLRSIVAEDPRGESLPTWYQHFLGRRFRGKSGKFFTPKPLASAMAELLPVKKDAVVMDPTCGGGTFLTEASRVWQGVSCSLVANDVDISLVDLTQMVLDLGTPRNHKKSFLRTNLYEPDTSLREWYGRVDYILANPPFSLKTKMLESEHSRLFNLGYATSDALLLDIALDLLRPGGRLVCLLPHSIIANTEFQQLRLAVRESWKLLGVIGLPEGVFHLTADTTTRADIVILEKLGGKTGQRKAVFASAPSIGTPLNGRTKDPQHNYLSEIVKNREVLRALGLTDSGSV